MATAAVQPFAPAWEETEALLRYSLSDYSLFSVRLLGRTYAVPLAPLLPATFQSDLEELLKSAPADIPVLCIRNLPLAGYVPRIQFANGRLKYTLNQNYQYYADLRGSFDNYLASLSGKSRSTLRRKVKKFANMNGGTVDWRVYTTAEQMSVYHNLARQVAVKTYQERLFHGALPAGKRFRSELQELASAGRIRGYVMFSKDAPIAYLHLPIHAGIVEYAYLGYDPAHAALSPGSVLLYSALEDLFSEQRFSYFDFSYGAGQTKEVFSTGKYLRADAFYFTRSLKHCVLAYGHMALNSTSAALGLGLERIHLRASVKKLLRRS